jgi:hypothetical protein
MTGLASIACATSESSGAASCADAADESATHNERAHMNRDIVLRGPGWCTHRARQRETCDHPLAARQAAERLTNIEL